MPDQPTNAPTKKVSAAILGGAFATIFAWGLGAFTSVDVPVGIESAFAVVFTVGAAYFTSED